ncbi:MAG TPA: HAD family hydrolase [Candidatus Saccharimonadales bacterium]|nr:HAD family hydrolase [Candidatus Saccharimonadales bacterium]
MTYQALIFDLLDGTAIPLQQDGAPSQRLIDAVHWAHAHSALKLCAATGRAITKAKYIFDALQLTDPCVISAGTQIVDPMTDKILWQMAIPEADVAKVLQTCMRYPYEILCGNEVLGEGKPASQRQAVTTNVMYIMGCSQGHAQLILDDLKAVPDIKAIGVGSWTLHGVDIHVTHKQATKEHAITELLRMLNIPKEATIGIGDDNNDINLFNGVGHRIAMGNAKEELKALADEVCGSVDSDGLAEVIERYGGGI